MRFDSLYNFRSKHFDSLYNFRPKHFSYCEELTEI
jgi:hypothetical protein